MHNYIAADLKRLFRRVPRIVVMLITFAVFCIATFIYVSVTKIFADPSFAEVGLQATVNSDTIFNAIQTVAGTILGFFGLFEIIYVFSDDFKAKTTQIAIGTGISRTRVILSKFFELAILLAVDMVVMLGLSMLMSIILGSMLTAAQILALLKVLAVGMLLSNIAYGSLVIILLFTTRSMTLGILSFLALHFHVVSGVISLTGHVKALAPLNLSNYTLTHMLGKISGMAEGAALNPVPFLGCAAYIILALVITSLIFRKQELEF